MIKVIKNMYVQAANPTKCVDSLRCSSVCACVEQKIWSQVPKLGQQSQQHQWEESEGIYKQFNQQKRVIESVYYEHENGMDQFAPTPATWQ